MARTRTFIDAGVLMRAFRGEEDLAEVPLEVLDDPTRDFVTSDFVRLEVLPKPVCYRQDDEREFYESFFAGAKRTVHSSRALVQEAQYEAEQVGLNAVDALHVAAAKRARCAELVTTEKSTKPLFRVQGLAIISV
jgi:predicted nucleic acid-binding protein